MPAKCDYITSIFITRVSNSVCAGGRSSSRTTPKQSKQRERRTSMPAPIHDRDRERDKDREKEREKDKDRGNAGRRSRRRGGSSSKQLQQTENESSCIASCAADLSSPGFSAVSTALSSAGGAGGGGYGGGGGGAEIQIVTMSEAEPHTSSSPGTGVSVALPAAGGRSFGCTRTQTSSSLFSVEKLSPNTPKSTALSSAWDLGTSATRPRAILGSSEEPSERTHLKMKC